MSYGTETITYTYSSDGYRRTKTVNGVTTTYTYLDGQLLREERPNESLNYIYDNLGNLAKIAYTNGTTTTSYYVACNSRGDVEAIYNTSGVLQASYIYDAWGNTKVVDASNNEIQNASHIANINPIRYRGYYYDKETNFYYLLSRYYDVDTCRFISSDSVEYVEPEDVRGLNLYAYCANNPVIYADPNGHEWYNPLTWNWGEIAKGVGLIMTGIGAIAIGIVTLPYGGWISAVAGITILAGGGTALFGLSDVGEGITDYNVIQEAVFLGNENTYNTIESIFATSTTIGSMICGGYIKYNTTTTPRSLPGNGQKPHSGIWNINDKTLGYYGADGKLRYSIAFYDHGTPNVHRIPHWHTEMPHSKQINSLGKFIIKLIKGGF